MTNYRKLVYLRARSPAGYTLHYENSVDMGEVFVKEDGFYDWWPDKKGGYLPAEVLYAIAQTLDDLNEPYRKELEDFFRESERAELAADSARPDLDALADPNF